MRELFESDTRFYYAVGAFTALVFVAGLAVLAAVNPGAVGAVEVVGLVGGFAVFMLVYAVSISVGRLEERGGPR